MKYYRLQDDTEYPERWYLGDVKSVDNWLLASEKPEAGSNRLDIEVFQPGVSLDFTLSEVYGVPIVSKKIKEALQSIIGVDFQPVSILSDNHNEEYFVMIIREIIDCVDERRSEFQKFELNDPVRPDKAGDYRGFMSLFIKPDLVRGKDIFRIAKFETAIVVSEAVKVRLENIQASGARLNLII